MYNYDLTPTHLLAGGDVEDADLAGFGRLHEFLCIFKVQVCFEQHGHVLRQRIGNRCFRLASLFQPSD